MIKVIYTSGYALSYHRNSDVTDGKVYDVIKHKMSNSGLYWDELVIINDYGREQKFDLYNTLSFRDVTAVYRNEIINEILK